MNTQDFITYAQQYVPKFKVAFKDQSKFMKFLSFILFFNKAFMTRYITTIGYTVYVPNKAEYEANPAEYIDILTHEFTHMMDYKKYNLLFTLSYLLPQLLVPLSLFSLLAIHHSNLWLLMLLNLAFIAPIPAFFRSHWELRGYTMNAAFEFWQSGFLPSAITYVDRFADAGYYFMWPFKKNMEKRFQVMFNKIKDNSILKDRPYTVVNNFLKNNS